jgi:hypothetical protein
MAKGDAQSDDLACLCCSQFPLLPANYGLDQPQEHLTVPATLGSDLQHQIERSLSSPTKSSEATFHCNFTQSLLAGVSAAWENSTEAAISNTDALVFYRATPTLIRS